jgi:MSHA pilin protein MshC
MAWRNRGLCRGFTLVELVLVLLIAGVLAAVAVPRLLDRGAFESHGAAAEVRATLRHAQKLAMAKNREVCVTMGANAVTLSLNATLTPGAACSVALTRPGDGAPYTITLPAGVGLTPALGFRFDGSGRPNPDMDMTWTLGGSLALNVSRETGYVQ